MPHYYVTTPIYYATSRPHLGNAYTTTLADMLARFYRYSGADTFFLTGTDEHGQKVAETAKKAGLETQEFVDRLSSEFAQMWRSIDIQYSRFIRTTDPDHKAFVQRILQQLYDQGDIYFGKYTGLYCVGCERYLTEKELDKGLCPQHLVAPDKIEEENYFFRMEKYRAAWIHHFTEVAPDCVRPERYKNELLGMLREPLEDLSISRPENRLTWGIPLPFDPTHVTYVWFDALMNYLTGIGYPSAPESKELWANSEHLIAKDILKPHAVYWPTMLLAAGIPPYKHLTVHGYWVVSEQKISKSLGNAVDPLALSQEFGNDALRYFYFREMSFGLDSNYTEEAFINRYNADLANNLGNLVSRTLAMAHKFHGGRVPTPGILTEREVALQHQAHSAIHDFLRMVHARELNRALESLWSLIDATNVYIQQQKPWTLAKDPEQRVALDTTIYTALETIRIVASLLSPILPSAGTKILQLLGFEGKALEEQGSAEAISRWGGLPSDQALQEGESLFPRKELPGAQNESTNGTEKENGTRKNGTEKKMETTQSDSSAGSTLQTSGSSSTEGVISFDEFQRVDLRVAQILAAEKVEKSEKLLKLRVDVGPLGERQIVAGIAKVYEPDAIIGRKVVVVANLKPAKLMGLERQGMLLAGSDDLGNLELISPGLTLAPGSVVR